MAHGQKEALYRAADSQGTGDGHLPYDIHGFVRAIPWGGQLLVSILGFQEGANEAGLGTVLIHLPLHKGYVGFEKFAFEIMPVIFLLLPGTEDRRDVAQEADYIRKSTGGRDGLEKAKCRMAQDLSRVRAAPAEARDRAGGELFYPFDVIRGILPHEIQESIPLFARIGMKRGAVACGHQLGC